MITPSEKQNDLFGTSVRSDTKMSTDELSNFLKHLAHFYNSEKFGNPRLAKALLNLAKDLKKKKAPEKSPPKRSQDNRKSHIDVEKLRKLDVKAIEKILSDSTTSKAELIELAWSRFSIARGKLLKANIDTIRQNIRSALSHEKSLKIIMQEANRRGTQRSS